MKRILFLPLALLCTTAIHAMTLRAKLELKVPGNDARTIQLTQHNVDAQTSLMTAREAIPLTIVQRSRPTARGIELRITLTADESCYFRYDMLLSTSFRHTSCQFLLPGFWYRRNLRSPAEAPSFHTSDSWQVREDRLSSPLCGIYDPEAGRGIRIARLDAQTCDALTTHREGEVILSGPTTIGYTGFSNEKGQAAAAFGFPYRETPRSYIRKLTLAPPVTAFMKLERGQSVQLSWEITYVEAADYSQFVARTWEYAFDTYRPEPVEGVPETAQMKAVLSRYFTESYTDDRPLKYTSGVHLRVDDCARRGSAEVGFVGRVLLNAFNALEYAGEQRLNTLHEQSLSIFDSYLRHGFSDRGFFHEFVDYESGFTEPIHSIRRQAEGVYAVLHFLKYESERGRRHPDWEAHIRRLLDRFVELQLPDGSLPRKFDDTLTITDPSGGSTPSATLPLTMGYAYFRDKRYLAAAERTVAYLEHEIISKADYFSSTLDANCEDKEASLYAATAAYYMALLSKGEPRAHYADLCRRAAYFALSWYYTWDVPFAEGQMLGDLGFRSRGWGNVSVENNHVDVFVFEFTAVLDWLTAEFGEPRFSAMAEVIGTSMRQLLPTEERLCGVAKPGFYPEVVQHTAWDYGRNGKGFYNDIFAPGWVVASLWELLTPHRTEQFLEAR